MGKFDLLFRMNILLINFGSKLLGFIRSFNLCNRRLLKKNISITKNNKKCSILGLGPSLNKLDFSLIEDSDIICVNRFSIFAEEKKINVVPKIYILLDNYFFNEGLALTKNFIKKYSETQFILNLKFKNKIKDCENVYFVGTNNSIIKKRDKLSLLKNLHFGNNVLHSALEIAFALNYEEVQLFGCDFNSFCKYRQVHCYNDELAKSQNIKHYDELFNYSFSHFVHTKLNEYATYNGIKVINYSEGSILDAYTRGTI